MISKYDYDTSNGILSLPGSTDSRPSLWSGGGCSTIRNTSLMAWNQMDAKMDAKPNTKV